MPKFNNVPNKCHIVDGKELWVSRSVATVTVIIAFVGDHEYVLLGKRGTGCPDENGKWNCPCGYLDHNETTTEGAKREVWEETGFDVESIPKHDVAFDMDVEFGINSDPSLSPQNVTIRYGFVFRIDELPTLSDQNSEENEIADLKWVKVVDGKVDGISDEEFAYNHDTLIKTFCTIGTVK
jgi:8-oxo-dGTP pyrophosphatase MutT (NUDIX family)